MGDREWVVGKFFFFSITVLSGLVSEACTVDYFFHRY